MIPARVLWAAPADEVVTDPAAATAPAVSGNDPGPKRESLALLPSWALEQKAAANRQLIVITRQRWAAGEEVARMYQEPGLAWLERQAEAAERLLAERKADGHRD